MQIKSSYILLLCLACSYWIDSVQSGSSGAIKLNDYLVENCKEKDLESNLKCAKDFLQSLTEKKSSNKELISDLNTFLSLEQISNGTKRCTVESVAILTDNNRLAGDVIRKYEKDGSSSLRRIEKVILDALRDHAEACWRGYYPSYTAKISTLNKLSLKFVKENTSVEMVEEYTVLKVVPRKNVNVEDLQSNLVVAAIEARDTDKMYTSGVVDEKTGKKGLDKEKYSQLYEKYVQEPCKNFINQTREILEPAIFDSRFSVSYGISHEAAKMYNGCQVIVKNSKKILKEMIDYASKPENFEKVY